MHVLKKFLGEIKARPQLFNIKISGINSVEKIN